MKQFKDYNNIFCDSKEALEWLYKNGLSKDALVRTSSPSLLFDKGHYNINHVERRWPVGDFQLFQTSINDFVKDIYTATYCVDGVSREQSLAVSIAALVFHIKLYKAACLTELDLVEPRLIVRVDGVGGPNGNNMNSPWESLLSVNKNIKTITYRLKSNKWSILTTQGLSWISRYRIAGIGTAIFRLSVKMWRYIPNFFIKKEVIILFENELVIETAASLALKGVALKYAESLPENNINNVDLLITPILSAIQPIVQRRLSNWITPGLIKTCEKILYNDILEKTREVRHWRSRFDPYFNKVNKCNKKVVVLSNTLLNNKGIAVAECCRENKIPIISTQHGVTYEICSTHDEMSVIHEINLSNKLIVYNDEAKTYAENSGFNNSNAYVVGISSRHRHTKLKDIIKHHHAPPIVFVSTNLYRGNLNLFSTWNTDFDRAKEECALVELVFSKLPYAVRYKIYPEENRRYADRDPVLDLVDLHKNIELYDTKIDMRYLISQHRVCVTTKATSTLSWLVMSGKPVVFINSKKDMPLTLDANKYFSKGLFLFDDDDDGFYENIKEFLSQPIEIIEKQWEKKGKDRALMIKRFFSSFPSGAGRRAADMIYSDYLK